MLSRLFSQVFPEKSDFLRKLGRFRVLSRLFSQILLEKSNFLRKLGRFRVLSRLFSQILIGSKTFDTTRLGSVKRKKKKR